MSDPTPKDARGPINLRIKFRSASLDQFIERYAADVSRGGIFIRTREPLAVGTRLKLELQLQDAAPLLSGEGTVVWIRENDPARENAAPGMGVRFDKLAPESQPTLEKILTEKARLEQAGGGAAGKAGGGMAVRRPSAVLSTLDAQARAALPTSPSLPAAGATGPAPTTGENAALGTPGPAKTGFLASRAAGVTPVQTGPFSRARHTTGRPVPVPSALFEPPTAADIDKALESLREASGPTPSLPAPPTAPRYVADDLSNEPTRVADVVDELVGAAQGVTMSGLGAPAPVLADGGAEDAAADGGGAVQPIGNDEPTQAVDASMLEPSEASAAVAPAGEAEAAVHAEGIPEAPNPGVRTGEMAQPDVSRRFRAASKAYPTLQRRGGVKWVIAAMVVIGAGVGAAVKLHLFDRTSSHLTTAAQAPAIAIEPPATPPAPTAAAPEGAGGAAAATAQPAAPEAKTAPAPAADDEGAAKKPVAVSEKDKGQDKDKKLDEKAADESGAGKHRVLHKKAHEGAEAVAAGKAAPANDDKAPAAKTAADKPTADKSAAAPTGDATGGDKPVPAAAATPAPIVKITSTPAGAQIAIDGKDVGVTPYQGKDLDPAATHFITLKKDGYDSSERMVSGLDWSRAKGSTPQSLKVTVKLRRTPAAAPAAAAPKDVKDVKDSKDVKDVKDSKDVKDVKDSKDVKDNKENAEPEDTGGPYIKEVNPGSP